MGQEYISSVVERIKKIEQEKKIAKDEKEGKINRIDKKTELRIRKIIDEMVDEQRHTFVERLAYFYYVNYKKELMPASAFNIKFQKIETWSVNDKWAKDLDKLENALNRWFKNNPETYCYPSVGDTTRLYLFAIAIALDLPEEWVIKKNPDGQCLFDALHMPHTYDYKCPHDWVFKYCIKKYPVLVNASEGERKNMQEKRWKEFCELVLDIRGRLDFILSHSEATDSVDIKKIFDSIDGTEKIKKSGNEDEETKTLQESICKYAYTTDVKHKSIREEIKKEIENLTTRDGKKIGTITFKRNKDDTVSVSVKEKGTTGLIYNISSSLALQLENELQKYSPNAIKDYRKRRNIEGYIRDYRGVDPDKEENITKIEQFHIRRIAIELEKKNPLEKLFSYEDLMYLIEGIKVKGSMLRGKVPKAHSEKVAYGENEDEKEDTGKGKGYTNIYRDFVSFPNGTILSEIATDYPEVKDHAIRNMLILFYSYQYFCNAQYGDWNIEEYEDMINSKLYFSGFSELSAGQLYDFIFLLSASNEYPLNTLHICFDELQDKLGVKGEKHKITG